MADDLDPTAVERAARAIDEHAEAESELGLNHWRCKGCGEPLGSGRKSRAGLALRSHQARAALAAARAGEAVRPETDDEQGVRLLRENRDYWRAVAEARTADLRDERAAQRGGEAVDREAPSDLTDAALVDLYWRTTRDDWAIPDDVMVRYARAVLAARGDAPVRSVSADALLLAAERAGVEVDVLRPVLADLRIEVTP